MSKHSKQNEKTLEEKTSTALVSTASTDSSVNIIMSLNRERTGEEPPAESPEGNQDVEVSNDGEQVDLLSNNHLEALVPQPTPLGSTDAPRNEVHNVTANIFPTISDLAGLLISSRLGYVFINAQEEQLRRRSVMQSRPRRVIPLPAPALSTSDAALSNIEPDEALPERLSEFLRRQGAGYNAHTATVMVPITSQSGHVVGVEEVKTVNTASPISPVEVDALHAARYENDPNIPADCPLDNLNNVLPRILDIRDDEGIFQASYFRYIYLTMFFVFVCFVIYIVGGIIMLCKPQTIKYPYKCTTDNCKRIGAWIKNAMDDKVHPCNDFYQFACGKYVEKHYSEPEAKVSGQNHLYRGGIPVNFADNPTVGIFLKKVTRFPDNQLLPFYQACIDLRKRNEAGAAPLVNLLSQIRLLSVQSSAYFSIISRFNIARMMGHIFRRTNHLFFFDFDDIKDDHILFKVAQPSSEVILASPKIYADAMKKCWQLLSKDLFIDDPDEIDTIVYLVMKFEAEVTVLQSKETENYIYGFPVRFDEIIPPPEKFHPNYIKMRGRFQWEELVGAIMDYPPDNFDEYLITFNWWHSFKSKLDRYYAVLLVDKLENTPAYVIFRYFQWKLIKIFAFDLTEEVQNIMFDIFGSSGSTLVERCFRSVFSNLHVLAAHRYKAIIKDSSIHINTTALINQVFQTFKDSMTGKNSLPSVMKSTLAGTVNTLKILTISGDNDTDQDMKIFYDELKSGKNHFANVIKARAIKARNAVLYARHKPPFDKRWHLEYSLTEWTETSIADAVSTTRYIQMPLGGIQEPFFENDLPILNYAGFGHYLVALPLARRAVEDLLQVYESNLRVIEPRVETSLIKDFQREFVQRVECLMETHLNIRLKKFPEFTMNPLDRETKMRILSHAFSVELILDVIDEMANASATLKSFKPYKSHFDELKHGNKLIGKRFPQYQILPGLEKFTPVQIAFLSMARHHCESFSRRGAEMRMKKGPIIDEILLHGSFRNTEAFAKAWKCPKGSFMNPSIKCPQLPPETTEEVDYVEVDTTRNSAKTKTDDDENYYAEEDPS